MTSAAPGGHLPGLETGRGATVRAEGDPESLANEGTPAPSRGSTLPWSDGDNRRDHRRPFLVTAVQEPRQAVVSSVSPDSR